MTSPSVLLLEYFSSGLYRRAERGSPPEDLLAEGYAMLLKLAEDFAEAGFKVTALLDSELKSSVSFFKHAPQVYDLSRYVSDHEYFYVVAPSARNQLLKLVMELHEAGLKSLNAPLSSIELASDKYLTYLELKRANLPVPHTVRVSAREDFSSIKAVVHKDFSYPVVVKPSRGDGCSGLSLAFSDEDLEKSIRTAGRVDDEVVVQDYVRGRHVSVSAFVKKGRATLLSCNSQLVRMGRPGQGSEYIGGVTPEEVPSEAALKAALAVHAEGYVGIDAVQLSEELMIIEVNPRLTTPYVALREVSDFSLARAFLHEGELRPRVFGKVMFYKGEAGRCGNCKEIRPPGFRRALSIKRVEWKRR